MCCHNGTVDHTLPLLPCRKQVRLVARVQNPLQCSAMLFEEGQYSPYHSVKQMFKRIMGRIYDWKLIIFFSQGIGWSLKEGLLLEPRAWFPLSFGLPGFVWFQKPAIPVQAEATEGKTGLKILTPLGVNYAHLLTHSYMIYNTEYKNIVTWVHITYY